MRHVVPRGLVGLAALALVPALVGAAVPRTDWRTLAAPAPAAHFRGAHPTYAWRQTGRYRRQVAYPTQIQHVVVIEMENRSVDNLFAGYYGQQFGNGQTWDQALNLTNPNASPQLTPVGLEATFDPNHAHNVGFITEAAGNWSGEVFGCPGRSCPPNATAYAYVPTYETAPYAYFIQNYAFANSVYQANEGPSFVAHQYSIAGQAGGSPGALTAPYAFAENPQKPLKSPPKTNYYENSTADVFTDGFCEHTTRVDRVVDMTGPYSQDDTQSTPVTPCNEYSTVMDEMSTAYGPPYNQDWQYVAHRANTIWAAPLAVKHLAQQYYGGGSKTAQPFAIDPNAWSFVSNLQSKTPTRPFANLTYLTPCMGESDHPNSGGNADGPEWLAWVVNAIGQSPYWQNTAIFVVWDDWGGWYDHAQPGGSWPYHPGNAPYGNPSDPNEWGFRVPMMVISPYVTARGYVSNSLRSQSAILHFVEDNFGIASLGTDDADQNDDLSDMFNMSQQPMSFTPYPLGGYQPPHC
jgi:hypothetical protein